ncbi:MAG: hypothetical protein OET81_10140 [Desulfobacteraceae bacterium]|nr:hypothetical protein [Desulfobacteraceae bacterium]MDH3573429.1 hypothetical protein [Desulfobacteraceae bacterium]MDH3721609.1 hypothetical protein [Desulfobacteraceae bacterium]MDH3836205.1 hypothetical protein [Desulfobacteraceae bacterium]MDH3874519.1 hypothetical protein [Desulfobacteraceae bacterium]
MLNIRNKISGRLKNRGLAPIEITRLIKDVYNIIGSEWYFTTADVKYALERLGWERYLLDNYTLELIFLYLDDQALVGLNRHVVH